jgi:alpha-L-fucosidase
MNTYTALKSVFFCSLWLVFSCDSPELAKPSEVQYKWHEQERIMFVCLDPCTWQGREYDNHSTPLERINPEKLNTDQWCETALSWGAREILFVAKHTGGFCWWPTETTDYGIRNTPYKNGKGDVLKELSESCRKYGLNLGIYVYPGDDTWGAGIGSGGRTSDPEKQEAYNEVFRTQLTEVLANYGEVMEIWFDGSCVIDISDIMERYAGNSVVFQGPHASLRWPGTESGKLFYPAWNTLRSENLKTGVATQIHGDPDGDAWAPLETNTTLYDHYWFWAPWKEEKRKSIDHLMECYYKSVGYGSVFLLNSTPDTTGLIPDADVEHYKAFTREIDRRFSTPVAEVREKSGNTVVLSLPDKMRINHVVTMEDYREGHRIRAYRIEGLTDSGWTELCNGQSVGRKKIDYFPETEVSKIRLTVDENVGKPLIRNLSAYYVENFREPPYTPLRPWSDWAELGIWESTDFTGELLNLEIDLSVSIKLPGQFAVRLLPENQEAEMSIVKAEIHFEGQPALSEFATVNGNEININRTAMVTPESRSVLLVTVKCVIPCKGKITFRPSIIY